LKSVTDPDFPDEDSPLRRFERSMVLGLEAWREGSAYDLDALAASSGPDRAAIEGLLLQHQPRNWNDIEALALLNSPAGNAAIGEALENTDGMVRVAVLRFAPDVIGAEARNHGLVAALETTEFYGGLTQAMLLAETFHPPAVIEALWRGAKNREGEVAMHFAALLMYLYGQASEAFDWELRPFFLTLNTKDPAGRAVAYRELCERLGYHGGGDF